MSSSLPTNLERISASVYILVWIYALFRLTDYTGTMFGLEDINTLFGFVPVVLLWAGLPFLLLAHGRVVVHSAVFWLALFLTAVILYGSLVSMRMGIAFDESFLRYVIIMVPVFGAICVGYRPPSERINRIAVHAGTIFSFLCLTAIIYHHAVSPLIDFFHILKEEMFFTVAVFASRLFSDADKTTRYRMMTHLLGVMIIVAGILTTKFTTYFSVFLVIACYGIHIVIEGRHVARTLKGVIVGAHVVAIAVVLLPLYFPSEVALPDGSPVAREFLYGYRFNQFFESPWIGTLFVGEQRIVLWRMNLPSHSNIIDLLAMGGVMCFLVYVAIVVLTCIAAWRIGRRSVPGPFFNGYGNLVCFIYIPLSATFNPIWGQVGMGLAYWLAIGLVAGTALRLAEEGTLRRVRPVPTPPSPNLFPGAAPWPGTGSGPTPMHRGAGDTLLRGQQET